MSQNPRPRVAVLLSDRARRMVLRDAAAARLEEHADVVWAPGDTSMWNLDELLRGADAAITGWFTVPLMTETLDRNPQLRFVAHTAGTVRGLIPLEAIGPRLRVSQATQFFAPSVSEFTIMQILSGLRHLPALDRELKAGAAFEDFDGRLPAGLIASRTAGVVGASRSGQAVIRLLKAFGARVLVVDPTVSPDFIRELGAEPSDLAEMLPQADIVTLHAPLLSSTEGLMGAEQFSMIKDGALFVNSARGGLVDDDALYAEVSSGRISAALDVFAQEPLPLDDRWRRLDNVIISPHRAGFTVEAHLQNGDAMVDEIIRWAHEEDLLFEMPVDRVAVIA